MIINGFALSLALKQRLNGVRRHEFAWVCTGAQTYVLTRNFQTNEAAAFYKLISLRDYWMKIVTVILRLAWENKTKWCTEAHVSTLRYGQYLTHTHNHITQPTFRDASTGFPRIGLWATSTEIPYSWHVIASHAGVFRGARFMGRDERRAPLKTPAWEARHVTTKKLN